MLLLGVICPVLASAAELYRYVDERGVVVLDRHGVPPQHISRGYQVLNEQGRVVREVPPAPTAEEFARLQAKKARDASDAQLLRLYASVEDVERAETRKLAELASRRRTTSGRGAMSLRTCWRRSKTSRRKSRACCETWRVSRRRVPRRRSASPRIGSESPSCSGRIHKRVDLARPFETSC